MDTPLSSLGTRKFTKDANVGFLDRESIFGYKWDTVLIFSIITILTITLLFRFGVIQVQIV